MTVRRPFLMPLCVSSRALLLFFFGSLGCAAGACSKSASTAEATGRERPPKAVQTETVRQENVNRTVNLIGTLAAENDVTISSQAEGIVSRILADLGDRVASGQPLVE